VNVGFVAVFSYSMEQPGRMLIYLCSFHLLLISNATQKRLLRIHVLFWLNMKGTILLIFFSAVVVFHGMANIYICLS